ncbi:MAG: SDR family oxidoreductase [Nocardioides sp.]|uniref:SDR family oxidoreductase n=1 Tax=Nocardioides sp. TaxID=35761 RepID=UPI003F081E8A
MSTYVITGAGSGIGQVLAEQLTARGDSLVLLVRDESRRGEVAAAFPAAQVLVADLAEPGTLNGLGREVDGPVDGLVQVAGTVELGRVERLRLADWQHQLDVNLTSPAVLTREFLPALRAGRGTLVYVNSTAGLGVNAEWAAYSASKFGLRALADAVRAEEREHGVRVTTVYPSRTATPMQEKVHAKEGKEYDASDWIAASSVADTIRFVLDLPRDASLEEVTVRPGPR